MRTAVLDDSHQVLSNWHLQFDAWYGWFKKELSFLFLAHRIHHTCKLDRTEINKGQGAIHFQILFKFWNAKKPCSIKEGSPKQCKNLAHRGGNAGCALVLPQFLLTLSNASSTLAAQQIRSGQTLMCKHRVWQRNTSWDPKIWIFERLGAAVDSVTTWPTLDAPVLEIIIKLTRKSAQP